MKHILSLFLCFIFLCSSASAEGDYPVYALKKRNHLPGFDLTLINDSGVKSSSADSVTFNDGAVLTYTEDAGLTYGRYEGMTTVHHIDGSPSEQRPYDTLAAGISKLASRVYAGTLQDPLADQPLRETLGGVTLAEAQAQAEALFQALDVSDPVCAYALDMTLARIHALDAADTSFRAIRYSFDQATAADEGYYMVYRARVDGALATEGFFFALLYVDSRGIASLSLRSEYTLDQKVGTVRPQASEAACIADICQAYGVAPEDVHSTGIKLYAEQQNGQTRLLPYYTFRYDATIFTGETLPMHAAYSILDGRLLFSGTGARPVE